MSDLDTQIPEALYWELVARVTREEAARARHREAARDLTQASAAAEVIKRQVSEVCGSDLTVGTFRLDDETRSVVEVPRG